MADCPQELQFQRFAHDANLGKQTSDLMRLSPEYYQRFGTIDRGLRGHLEERLAGLWEFLISDEAFGILPQFEQVWIALCNFGEAYQDAPDTGSGLAEAIQD